jgi:hypothetical protein
MHIFKWSTIDAWGTCTTPLGTFNVIRQNERRLEFDTVDIYTMGFWINEVVTQVDSNRTYSFWANGLGYPVVTLTDFENEGTIDEASWIRSTPSQVGIAEQFANSVIVYPNPASDNINFVLSAQGPQTIAIYNTSGALVETVQVNNSTGSVDVSAYASGLYVYNCVDASGNVTLRGKFNVAH